MTGWVRIEQRWYRGDLDVVKSERGQPGVTPGQSGKERLGELSRTDDDSYVFDRGDGQPWDYRKLMRDWIRPLSQGVGDLLPRFGFPLVSAPALNLEPEIVRGVSDEAKEPRK